LDGAVKVGVVWALRGWLYVPICLAMWVDIFRRSSRDEVHRLLATLAVVSVPLAAMYSLSEVGVPIYPHLGWAPQSVGSATIVRDFLTFPFWAKLGLAWYVTRPKQSPASLLAIAALLMACVLTYTRSIEIPAALCVLVALVLPLATTRNWGVVGRRMMAFAGLTAVAIAGLAILAPGNLAFSYQRIHELARNGENSANVASRVETFSIASRTSYAANGVFGAGASVSGASRVDALWEQGLMLADSLWTFTVIGIGLAGVASFAVLFAVFLWRAVRLCLLGETVSRLGGVMLIVIVWDIIRSPASSEFVTLYPIVSGLFMAVVAIEIRGAWRLVRENTGA
jgi:O-antigen ligase